MNSILTLDLISQLITALKKEDIPYCHWTGNANLQSSLCGDSDLDILVDKRYRTRFGSLMSKLGFTRVISYNECWFPDVYHYYGYDVSNDKLVHIHLYYKLIVGYDLIQNYHLPVEKQLLESASENNELRVPLIELEYIVFVIKTVLQRRFLSWAIGHPKYWFRALLGKGRGCLPQPTQKKLHFLKDKVDLVGIKDCLSQYFPYVHIELFQHCVDSLLHPEPGYSWYTAGRRLTRVLKPYRRHGSIATIIIVIKRSLCMWLNKVLCRLGCRHVGRKQPVHGGKIIAFVGGDGSGKTTNVAEVNRWFGNYFDVRTVHIGHPNRSILLFLISAFSKILKVITGKKENNFSRALILWCVGRDRYRCFRRARAMCTKGTIVCLDRIPISGMMMMDTPRIRRLVGDEGIYSWLARREEYYHLKIRGVDEIIVLKLDPRIAMQRRPEDDKSELQKRSGEIWKRKWTPGHDFVVDAAQPLDEVKNIIRCRVWEVIGRRRKTVEIAGLAGSGKTIAAEELRERTHDVQIHLSVREHKIRYIKALVVSLPLLVYLKCKSFPFVYWKNMILLQVTLELLCSSKGRNCFVGKALVFDQGPIYLLVSFQVEMGSRPRSKALEAWVKKMAAKMSEALDIVIWLEASDNALRARIDSREQIHRIKNSLEEQANMFLNSFRVCYEMLTSGKLGGKPIMIHHINTEKNLVNDVFKNISALILSK